MFLCFHLRSREGGGSWNNGHLDRHSKRIAPSSDEAVGMDLVSYHFSTSLTKTAPASPAIFLHLECAMVFKDLGLLCLIFSLSGVFWTLNFHMASCHWEYLLYHYSLGHLSILVLLHISLSVFICEIFYCLSLPPRLLVKVGILVVLFTTVIPVSRALPAMYVLNTCLWNKL